MEKLRIGETDVFLEDEGNGRGKIIIANIWGYNYSYFWGAMGSSLREFLLTINKSYFIDKLIPSFDNGKFDGKKTMTNVRRYIREELSYEIPWYKYMPAQKDLREKLKEMESIDSEELFINKMMNISDNIDCFELDRHEEREFMEAVKTLEVEPWHYIEYGDSRHQAFLSNLFPRLQKELKKKPANLEK